MCIQCSSGYFQINFEYFQNSSLMFTQNKLTFKLFRKAKRYNPLHHLTHVTWLWSKKHWILACFLKMYSGWEIFRGGGCADPITAWPHIAWTSHLFSRLPAVCLKQWSSQIQTNVVFSTSSTHALMVKPCTTLEQRKLWCTLKFALTCLAREREQIVIQVIVDGTVPYLFP